MSERGCEMEEYIDQMEEAWDKLEDAIGILDYIADF